MAMDAQVDAPMLIRQPNIENKNVNELTILITPRACLPSILPAKILLMILIKVVLKIVSMVGKRYFLSIRLTN